MLYDVEETAQYRKGFNLLEPKMKRFAFEAKEIIKEYPTEYQNRITYLCKRKDNRIYRYRIPGAFIIYIVHKESPVVTLTQIDKFR